MNERRLMAHCVVSIDGYSSGPGGPEHDTWLYEHVMRPATGEFFEGIRRGRSTALLGRNNTPDSMPCGPPSGRGYADAGRAPADADGAGGLINGRERRRRIAATAVVVADGGRPGEQETKPSEHQEDET